MVANWPRYCRVTDMVVDEPTIDVAFSNDRKHRVVVTENDDSFLISGVVIRRSIVSSLSDLPPQMWLRNRAVSLVGFRIDRRGRLIGESCLPKAGISPDEFQLYVRTVAIECDRFEYHLTGSDAE